ncbi:MAG: creatininase family protein [Actinomycetota bacterium]|nr:creatininase family protein [Actinomycetota bacterium]
MTRVRYFADLSGPQVAERLTDRSILVQPLGAIEQHGPHLPLSTDSVVATAVAEAAVAQVGDELDVWLLPTLEYTKSNEHAWSPGTVWLSATTLLAVLNDLGRCLATTPAKRLVFLNGHGGNSALLNVANRELRLQHGLMTFLTHPGVPADQGGLSPAAELGMGVHGGTDETSLMLHLAPHLVDMSKAERRVPEALALNQYVRFGGRVSFGWMSNDFFPDGYIGDPTAANSELGAQLFDGAVRGFCEALREIAVFDFGRPAAGPVGGGSDGPAAGYA